MRSLLLLLTLVLSGAALAQNGVSLVSSGYTDPTVPTVAPGQYITFYLTGVRTVLSSALQANRTPLPLMLGDFSATIRQTARNDTFPVPLTSVRQTNLCAQARQPSDCFTTAITVQIPFEIRIPGIYDPQNDPGTTEIVFHEGNVSSEAFTLTPVSSVIRLARTCEGTPVCVTHADGRPTTDLVKPGESLIVYAYGLGHMTPGVKTGVTSPRPAARARESIELHYSYTKNTGPSVNASASSEMETPSFVGLTPGSVGLYQINFHVPIPPSGTRPCGPPDVLSNLTIVITNPSAFPSSYDGFSLCVDTSASP